ncbi:MAG TPA: hypothetical protein VL334_20025 [Anaerolineae bacterium]|nr:hypothetical protein [Anaerolineae bacterium]
MEQVIGATELRQQLTDVLQAVREQRATYIVETFGRSQAAIVNLEDYRDFQSYQRDREAAFDQPDQPATGANAGHKHELSEDEILAIIEQARHEPGHVSDQVRRRAQGYLTEHVAMALRPGEPVLVWGDKPVWRTPVWLHLRGHGQVAAVGSLDVDAATGEVIPLSPDQIRGMQDRADVFARRLTPQTTAAG